jgi:hypothetical protein
MTTKARLILVVAVSLVTLGEGNLGADSARAEENCLTAPNAPTPLGSHWYYRTDPVKQRKCWYLRTEGQAIQKQAAQEKPETGVTAKRPAAVTAIIAPDQSGPEPLELRPGQVPLDASADRPTKGSIQHGAQASGQAGADKVAWPDPPSSANASRVAWPDTPSSASAGGVMWPDPPSPTRADKVAWPNPPLPAGAATHGATAENTPEERANQAQEVPGTPANSDKDAGTDAGKDRQVAKPIETAVSHGQMPVDMLLALAIGLILAGIIARLIVRMTIGRRRTVDPDRREVVWTTSIPSERTIPTPVAQRRELVSGSVDNDHLEDEVKEALRKLLRASNGKSHKAQGGVVAQ